MPHDDDPLKRYSDFNGKPTVVYPWSDAGLCHAIKIKEHLGRKGFLRSGLSSSGDGPLQGEGGLVVDFSCFARIEVRKTDGDGITIEVEAGASTQQLADALIRNNAFLPLGDNPVQSVVASVLSGRPGHFDRSMGRLRDHVESLAVITPQGELARFSKGDGEFDSVLDGTLGGAIKAITFSAVASSKPVEMMGAGFLYATADFEAAIRLLTHPGITPTMDLSVHAYHDVFGVIVVAVKIAGKPADHDRMAEVLDQLKSNREGPAREGTETRVGRVQASSPAEIVDLTVKGGLSGGHYVDRSLAAKHYEKVVAREDFDSFRTSFVRSMTVALAETRSGKAPRVAGSLRLSLDNQQNIVVSADVFLPKERGDAEVRFDGTATRLLGKNVMSRPRLAAQNLDRRRVFRAST